MDGLREWLAANAIGLAGVVVAVAAVAIPFLLSKIRLKQDLEILAALRNADIEPPAIFVERVEAKAKAVLHPNPWRISWQHLLTSVLIAFFALGAFTKGVAWPIRALNGFALLGWAYSLGVDLLFAFSSKFRNSERGMKLGARHKLSGDPVTGLSARRQKLLVRDRELGRLNPAWLPADESDAGEAAS